MKPPREAGRRLAQEQTRHPREEARAEAKRREESRDSRDKTRVGAQTAVQEREDAVTQVRERPQTPHGRQGRKPKKDLQWLASMYLAAEHEMTRIRCRWRHIVREKRAHNFPESERLPIQMLLFVWEHDSHAGRPGAGSDGRTAAPFCQPDLRIGSLDGRAAAASGGLFVRRMRDGCSGPVLLSLHHRHDGDL